MKAKPKQGMPLHQWIATGGKPSQFKGSKGITKSTAKKSK